MRNLRLPFVLILFFFFGAAILSRLVFLQILNREFYKALGEGQQKIVATTQGERGEIFFKNGEPIAINRTGKYVFLYPKEIKQKQETAEILAGILGLEQEDVLRKTQKTGLFEPLKHKLSEEEQTTLKKANLKGVYLEDEIYRYYPQKNLGSHVIGFLGGDNIGQYGIEGFYNNILSGKEVLEELEKGPFGYLLFSDARSLGSGANIFLTIDSSIQFKAEALLSESQERLEFDSGQIIVLDPRSGEILAMASIPNFDSNKYSEVEDPQIFQNPSCQQIFEPGSVLKPIVMAAGLNEEKINPKTTYIDKGAVKIGGWTIENYENRVWGNATMTEVLEKSINTGAVFVERQVGHNVFLNYLEKFGLFEKTGIDLQGEVYSENLELKKGYEVNYATASFGQGIEITPVQLARAFSAIANQGKLPELHLLDKIIENGSQKEFREKQSKEVISGKTASQLTAMLVSVVENGFAKSAQIDGYFIAGKTGTAQIPWPALGIQKSGYSSKTWQTFIGFAPAFDPQFLILVRLTDPQTKTAEYSAIPIFKELAKYIIDYWEIAPDHN